MPPDPREPIDDRAAGLAMLGCILFCAATGAGVGVFLQAPGAGAIAGAALGILLGLWVVPGLREWRG